MGREVFKDDEGRRYGCGKHALLHRKINRRVSEKRRNITSEVSVLVLGENEL